MENGVEALKLASSVLVFVIALSITISVFTSATQALNRMFSAKESEQYVTDGAGNYLNFVNFELDGGTREVGVETIIPSIYRAYKENYSIYFFKNDGSNLVLYNNNKGEQVNYIDLQKEVHASADAAIESVEKLLYQESDLYSKGFYNYLEGKTFIEKLGEYYMDDLAGETDIAEVNKVKKRVIVYIEK